MAEQEFKYLFTPFKIGNVTVSNRIFMSGAGVRLYPGGGEPNETAINYYQARAKGGAGLLIAPFYPFSLTTDTPPTVVQRGKATPAFNKELCFKHKVAPLEFDGQEDSIFHPYSQDKKQFMEYIHDHGTFTDVPVDLIVKAWKEAYGKARVEKWIQAFEKLGGKSLADFDREEVWKEIRP